MHTQLDEAYLDPLLPPPPAPPYYDDSSDAWVLSRYSDVVAAFREPRLALWSGKSKDPPETKDAAAQLRTRTETLAAISASRLAEWEAQIEPLAFTMIDQLPSDRPVNIVEEFARPWSLATAVIVTGAARTDGKRLESLARRVSLATADPHDSSLRSGADAANAELERSLQSGAIPMSGAAFVALSQTLPCFLANAWLALLRHPTELVRLRAEPDLMPKAIEELFRYAGLARKVSRRAMIPVELGDITIEQGARVNLMLATANRDPDQFADPDRLDLSRRGAGQAAFGVGSHSCVGASLIRMAAAVVTRVFVQRFESQANSSIEWGGGSGFRWAASLHVMLGQNSHAH